MHVDFGTTIIYSDATILRGRGKNKGLHPWIGGWAFTTTTSLIVPPLLKLTRTN